MRFTCPIRNTDLSKRYEGFIMTQLTFGDIDVHWRFYLADADYGDETPTTFELNGVIYV